MFNAEDRRFMNRVLSLAKRGRPSPNPRVGAVIVKRGEIMGEGWHRGPGQPHAEAMALQDAGNRSEGATLYVNLEPCCPFPKRMPPCTEAIIQSGIKRVVAAMTDPNPNVSGKGFALLRDAGIDVVEPVLRAKAARLNEAHIKLMTTGKPWVILKAAMTLDGRIATAAGESKWISSEIARREVHRLRASVDAVMVGIGTVLSDDPLLIPRHPPLDDTAGVPVRVIIDPRLKIPLTARVVTTCAEAPTVIVTTSSSPSEKRVALEEMGISVYLFPETEGGMAFDPILKKLGETHIARVLVEGGGRLNGKLLRSGEVDKVLFYMAPMLLGGDDAKGLFSGIGIQALADAIRIDSLQVRRVGPDIRVEGYIRKNKDA